MKNNFSTYFFSSKGARIRDLADPALVSPISLLFFSYNPPSEILEISKCTLYNSIEMHASLVYCKVNEALTFFFSNLNEALPVAVDTSCCC